VKETKIGNVQFTDDSDRVNSDPYIIANFGLEGGGKTRFPLTGPEVVAILPLERKSYFTIDKMAKEAGKRIFRPSNPDALIVNPRKVDMLVAEEESKCAKLGAEERQNRVQAVVKGYFRDHLNRVNDAMYALLDHADVRVLCVDTFGQYTSHVRLALYGYEDKLIRVAGKLVRSFGEMNQELIDLLNSFSRYGKHVVLCHKAKDEYEGRGDNSKATGKLTWEGFKYLGNHTNAVIEHEVNSKWDPNSSDEKKSGWHWRVNIRRCQRNPELEGPIGIGVLADEMITFAGLVQTIDPDADVSELM